MPSSALLASFRHFIMASLIFKLHTGIPRILNDGKQASLMCWVCHFFKSTHGCYLHFSYPLGCQAFPYLRLQFIVDFFRLFVEEINWQNLHRIRTRSFQTAKPSLQVSSLSRVYTIIKGFLDFKILSNSTRSCLIDTSADFIRAYRR